MPKAIPMAVRQSIISHYKKGISKSKLACNFQVGRTTISTLISNYEQQGEQGILTNYDNCGKPRPEETDFIYRAVRCFRTWHPSWGGEKIHAKLKQLRPDLVLPNVRTFYRWFHWNKQITPKSKTPKEPRQWATGLHEGWQIDAKEEMQTEEGQRKCWLNIVDEHSGTVIDPPVFSL